MCNRLPAVAQMQMKRAEPGNNGWKPLVYTDGYLLLEEHGLIGDRTSTASVGRDGGISWLCLPRFDAARFDSEHSRWEGYPVVSVWRRSQGKVGAGYEQTLFIQPR